MAVDHNARLIAELYATNDSEKATHITDEMVEIGDPIFPRQIYEAYKKFKNTPESHYFVSDLTRFNSSDVSEILEEIAITTQRDSDILMMLNYLTDIECFDAELVDKITAFFQQELITGSADEYEIESYFKYLKKSGKNIEYLEPLLQAIFESDERDAPTRRMALKKMLNLNPTKYTNFYYENYDSIKGKKSEIIFAEEISGWQNGIIPSLHKKILEHGSKRAQEILIEKQADKAQKKEIEEKKEQEKIKEEYSNADVISEIAKLRGTINKICNADNRFGFPIFPASEEIYEQARPASNKEELVGCSMVLRSIVQDFDSKIKEAQVSPEDIGKVIPGVTQSAGSINKFHFLLLDKGVSVDPGIFGLRKINRIFSKLAHPDEISSPELIQLLTEEKLLHLYKSDNWSLLHREILIKYRETLEKLRLALLEKP